LRMTFAQVIAASEEDTEKMWMQFSEDYNIFDSIETLAWDWSNVTKSVGIAFGRGPKGGLLVTSKDLPRKTRLWKPTRLWASSFNLGVYETDIIEEFLVVLGELTSEELGNWSRKA
jgi:hypothetical protein